MEKKVSIIIPLYNREQLIAEALASVQAQTYPHWEAIVIDDGSTDSSYELVKKIASEESRLKVYQRNRLPKGASACRNIGLKHATGEYIIFLDSDDLLSSFCLKNRLSVMEQNPTIDFAVFNMLLFRQTVDDTMIAWNVDSEERDLPRFLRADGVWSITGPIYRKKGLRNTKGFNETLPFWQDFEFHIRLLCQGLRYIKCLHLPPDCYNRRHNEKSISQRGFHSEDRLSTRITIYQDIVRQVEQNQLIDKDTGTAITVFLFNQARKLIIDHKNLMEALNVWAYAGQKGRLTDFLVLVGRYHLANLYRHQLSGRNLSVYLFLAKFTALLLPRKYKRIKSTLCKVTI